MATIPRHIIETRLDTGSAPAQMGTIALSGPGAISAPQLQPRSLQAPFYETPVDEVGPVVTKQALQNFGNTLLDITVSLADKKARMLSNDRLRKYEYILDNILNGENGYLQKGKVEAVKQADSVRAQIQQAEKDFLADETITNHVRLYLNPSVRDATDKALKQISNHYTVEARKAAIDDKNYKIDRISKNLIDSRYSDVTESNLEVMAQLDNIIFGSEQEKQMAKDYIFGNLVQYEKDSILIQGENASDNILMSRHKSFSDRVTIINDLVSGGQKVKNDKLVVDSMVKLNEEFNRRRISRDRQHSKMNEAAFNSFYADLIQGKAFNEEYAEVLRNAGIIDYKDVHTIGALFRKERDSLDKDVEDLREYADLRNFIGSGADRDAWLSRTTKAYSGKQISWDESKTLISYASAIEDQRFKMFSDNLSRYFKAKIITVTFPYRRDYELDLYAEALIDIDMSLLRLKVRDELNMEKVGELKRALDVKYGYDVRIKNSNKFVNLPADVPKEITNEEDAARITEYYRKLRKDEKISQAEFEFQLKRINDISILINRAEAEREEVKEYGDIIVGFPSTVD